MSPTLSTADDQDYGYIPDGTDVMLPQFQVRNLCADVFANDNSGLIFPMEPWRDGTISIHKKQYDDILAEKPAAALRYIDEDDGELVMVGSAFELDQRLQEPIRVSKPSRHAENSSNTGNSQNMHAFDIERSQDVVDIWRDLDRSTTEFSTARPRPTFGTPTKLCSSPIQRTTRDTSTYENRWATYGYLSGKFDQPPEVLSPHKPIIEEMAESQLDTHYLELHQIGAAAMQNEHGKSGENLKVDLPPHQPLLNMFEAELAKLMRTEPEENASKVPKIVSALQDGGEETALKSCPPTFSSTLHAHAPASPPLHTPGLMSQASLQETPAELLGRSIKSLFEGIGLFASTIKAVNAEIHQQIKVAQQDLPNSIETAVKASVAAIESLGSLVANSPASVKPRSSAARSQVTHFQEQQSDSGKPVGAQTEELVTMNDGHLTTLEEGHSRMMKRNQDSNNNADELYCTDSESKNGQGDLRRGDGKLTDISNAQHTSVAQGKSSMDKISGHQYEVQKILARRYISYGQLTGPTYKQYLVRWAGRSPEDDVWYDAANLWGCQRLIDEYEKVFPEVLHHCSWAGRGRTASSAGLHNRTAGDRMVAYNSDLLEPFDQLPEGPKHLARNPANAAEVDLTLKADNAAEPSKSVSRYTEKEGKSGYRLDKQIDDLWKSDRRPWTYNEYSWKPNKYLMKSGNVPECFQPLEIPRLGYDTATAQRGTDFSMLAAEPPRPGDAPDRAWDEKRAAQADWKRCQERTAAVPDSGGLVKPPLSGNEVRSNDSDLLLKARHQTSVEEDNEQPSNVRKPDLHRRQDMSPIRHRQSWHSTSTCDKDVDSPFFRFSPSSVMAKFPPVSYIEHPVPPKDVPLALPVTKPLIESSHQQDDPLVQAAMYLELPATGQNNKRKSNMPLRSSTVKEMPFSAHRRERSDLLSPRRVKSMAFRPRLSEFAELARSGPPYHRIPSSSCGGLNRFASFRSFTDLNNTESATNITNLRSQPSGHTWKSTKAQRKENLSPCERKIGECVKQLVEMGFQKSESEAVATSVEGNLDMAIDLLHEDRTAWERRGSQVDGRRVPGGWGGW